MASRTEHQVNVFALELLITDEAIEDCIGENMDYFNLCSTISFNPQLVTFKLYGMLQRGYKINLPEIPNSTFLKKRL